jgi:hypothetical protein
MYIRVVSLHSEALMCRDREIERERERESVCVCVYCDHYAQGMSGLRRRVLRGCVVTRWLPLHLVDVSC